MSSNGRKDRLDFLTKISVAISVKTPVTLNLDVIVRNNVNSTATQTEDVDIPSTTDPQATIPQNVPSATLQIPIIDLTGDIPSGSNEGVSITAAAGQTHGGETAHANGDLGGLAQTGDRAADAIDRTRGGNAGIARTIHSVGSTSHPQSLHSEAPGHSGQIRHQLSCKDVHFLHCVQSHDFARLSKILGDLVRKTIRGAGLWTKVEQAKRRQFVTDFVTAQQLGILAPRERPPVKLDEYTELLLLKNLGVDSIRKAFERGVIPVPTIEKGVVEASHVRINHFAMTEFGALFAGQEGQHASNQLGPFRGVPIMARSWNEKWGQARARRNATGGSESR